MTQQIQIGPHTVRGRAVLAPMAGLTDQVFRNICRGFGAALAVSEMSISDTRLWNSRKSETRLDLSGDTGLKVLQIAGSEPEQMAEAARAATKLGADIVDINMGCPAKKVCRKLSGSALLQDEALVADILDAVTAASLLPVTLKIRTGWNPANRNGVRIAELAEHAGIQALAVHGRTRACMFTGAAEFDTIKAIKRHVNIPVFANGDIETVEQAQWVLDYTGADAVMIGRGALGRPWFFHELNLGLNQSADTGNRVGEKIPNGIVPAHVRRATILAHLKALHDLYGNDRGLRVGRKHLTWYCKYLEGAETFRQRIVRIESAADQLQLTADFLDQHLDLPSDHDVARQDEAARSALNVEELLSAQESIEKEGCKLRQSRT